MYPKLLALFLFPLLFNACGYRVAVSPPWREKPSATQAFPFHKENYAALLDSAQLQGKPVFIDFYTTWCGPCRVMDRDVFTDPELARYFGQHFLNLKINAEQGEGPAFAKKFGISAYPTMLFLDRSGQVYKKVVGTTTVSKLLNVGRRLEDR